MSNLTSFDWWLATYLVAAGFGYAFYIGQLIVKLLLIRFASDKRIDDGLWRLGSLLETHYGELKENETITIQAKRLRHHEALLQIVGGDKLIIPFC
jgi:uncharacterized protein (DUF2225 family)